MKTPTDSSRSDVSQRRLRVCVLLGGDTGERSVSLNSGAAVAEALLRRGHEVRLLDPATGRTDLLSAEARSGEAGPASALVPEYSILAPEPGRTFRSLAGIDAAAVDVVAIVLHGGAGEDGRVQAVLDLRGIPYTGSGPGASAVAMDKVLAKRVIAASGVPVPKELLWGGGHDSADPPAPPATAAIEAIGGYPVVVKPIAGGSTIGLTIVRGPEQWDEAWKAGGNEIDPERGLLVEEYIPGRELTVGLLGDRALPVIEIQPKSGFYDFRRKYTKGETDYVCPADLPEETARKLAAWGLEAYRALGCRDMGRADFRLAPDGRAACLEVNTVPGMTATSLLPKAAAAAGTGFDDLVEGLCRRALARRARLL